MKKISRRTFLKAAGAAVFAAAAGTLGYNFIPGAKTKTRQAVRAVKGKAAHYTLANNVDAMNIRQVITEDSTTSRTIMWQSQYSEDGAVVEYCVKDSDDVLAVDATNEAFTDDDKTTYIHSATLTNLTPGTAYEYRVGYGDKRTQWIDLKTAQGADFKALIFPDSQSSDYGVWKDTEDPAWSRNQDAQFFINMGDLVDNGEDAWQWNAWFEVVEDMAKTIPVVPLSGNHETYTLNWKMRMPAAYLHYFAVPDNGLAKYPRQFYSFDYGDIHFTVLDTQFTELKDFEPDLEADEVEWCKKDLASTKKKWKIVLMHKDPLQYAFNPAVRSDSRENGFSDEGQVFMPIFDEYGVDAVISAHLHTYRDRGHIKNFQRDETGPLYILTGVAGNVRYPNLWDRHPLDVYVPPQPETDNYLTMEARENKIQFQCFLPDGTLLDTAVIEK